MWKTKSIDICNEFGWVDLSCLASVLVIGGEGDSLGKHVLQTGIIHIWSHNLELSWSPNTRPNGQTVWYPNTRPNSLIPKHQTKWTKYSGNYLLSGYSAQSKYIQTITEGSDYNNKNKFTCSSLKVSQNRRVLIYVLAHSIWIRDVTATKKRHWK